MLQATQQPYRGREVKESFKVTAGQVSVVDSPGGKERRKVLRGEWIELEEEGVRGEMSDGSSPFTLSFLMSFPR